MKLAFYKAYPDGDWLDRLIALHDQGPYSHVEIVFDQVQVPEGPCFSSSGRDGGTRFKAIDLSSGRWDLLTVPIFQDGEQAVLDWCRGKVGLKYDFVGVLAFAFRPAHQDQSKWFCSEICCAALQTRGLLAGPKPSSLSPNALYRLAGRWWDV